MAELESIFHGLSVFSSNHGFKKFSLLKLNVDGAMVSNGSKGGIGGIVRNNLKVCLDTFSLPIGPGPPIMAELEAIFHGLSVFSSNHGFKKFRLILETD
ncbi:hypothetical protein GQ457_11G007580 [Hibiscus cannabinus]